MDPAKLKCDKKYATYLGLLHTVRDKHGFIEYDQCDSLLFTSLLGCLPEVKVDILAARDNHGAWYRRPLEYPSCYTPSKYKTAAQVLQAIGGSIFKRKKIDKKEIMKILAGSGSTISRDMLLGLAWYCYFKKERDIAEQVIDYAKANNMVMGKGDPSRTIMTPGLLGTFAWVAYRLNGDLHTDLRAIPPDIDDEVLTGYQAHLQVLHSFLRWKLVGGTRPGIISQQFEREPNNPLFAIAAGKYNIALAILANPRLFPPNRLPTVKDRKEEWLPQRDHGDSWQPGEGDRVHSGGDFLFCYWLLNTLLPSS